MVTGREPGTQWKILATAWFSCLFVGFELPATQQCWLCAWGFYRLSVIQPRTVIDNHSALMRDQWDSNLQKKKTIVIGMWVMWLGTSVILSSLLLPGIWGRTCGDDATESWGAGEGCVYERDGDLDATLIHIGSYEFLLIQVCTTPMAAHTNSDQFVEQIWILLPKTNWISKP